MGRICIPSEKLKFREFSLILIVLIGSNLLIAYYNVVQNLFNLSRNSRFLATIDSTKPDKPFTILFWTPYIYAIEGMYRTWPKSECGSDHTFIISSNKSDYSIADIIIFEYTRFMYLQVDFPDSRNDAPWLLALQEAPIHHPYRNNERLNGLFNGSWSYQKNAVIRSDVIDMISFLRNKPNNDWKFGSQFSKEFLSNKTRLAAWVVSNCKIQASRRNDLRDELIEGGLAIDVYGSCGKYKCDKDYNKCFKALGKTYKFYLAFENALCEDYITEKIQHGLFNGMVPVVYAMGDVKQIAPPNSIINIVDFHTIGDLIKRIKYLDENPKEYFKYFGWRQNYNVQNINIDSHFYCSMWRRMKEYRESLESTRRNGHYQVIKNVTEWYNYFYNDNLGKMCLACLSSTDVNISHLADNRAKMYSDVTRC